MGVGVGWGTPHHHHIPSFPPVGRRRQPCLKELDERLSPEEWAQCYMLDVQRLLFVSNIHTHNATCYKYSEG
eukprot:gene19365-4961_t